MRREGSSNGIAAGVIAAVVLAAGSARGADFESCCDTSVRSDGSCVAQSAPCAASSGFAVGLSSLAAGTVGADWGDDSGVLSVSQASVEGGAPSALDPLGAPFPAGIDGYMSTTTRAPWSGLCVDAPSSQDPMHQGPTEPLGCISVSLAPGVSAQVVDFQFPVDARWDAYQLCYGLPGGATDAGASCANVNDSDDQGVSPTPVSGSCCGPAHLLTAQDSTGTQEWSVVVSDEIPGVPPPVLVLAPDGGPTVSYFPDAGDTLASLPPTCLSAYGEPSSCGQPPPRGDAGLTTASGACVPTTCKAQGAQCAVISDGCGGTLYCTNCSAKGTLSCATAPPGSSSDLSSWLVAAFGVTVLLGALWTRRRRARAIWADERRRFVVLFAALAGCLLAFYYFPRSGDSAVERWTAEYLRAYTRMVAVALGPFDPHVSAHGNVVSGKFSMQIVKSCDAMEANILFAAALLAIAAPWLRKVAALVVGLAALVTLNLVRLVALYWTGLYASSVFDFLHYDVWPLLMIAFAAADFFLCARWARGDGPAQPVPSLDHAAP